ncbi:energy-coupling factor ABC transporter ATP-binding protein [Candidatus Hecatella orcuttiae]|jgi:energy-coupling factor transporter ATP-binding protein EcfA2|uniref:energy-coupling factor ABC transporter ATP-binding protein n=1 Tax=Candidatus Hecatella orcuttiae TaxID=1935119 RepID=UPI00286831DA|nr:ATP-binding cassette domain-containing protein [Candidatus Hecatella orcuttiae]
MIEIEELVYTYPEAGKPALKDVNLQIRKGEFVVLAGPSGCGKTTLCRCLNGLIPHFYGGDLSGKIQVAQLDVLSHPTRELAQHVGLVFQNPENQLFSLTVERDVAFGLENLGLPPAEIRRRIDWALEAVGIGKLKDSAPHELSGGEQQKAAIACVLAMRPSVMVFDEPTSFLDPASAKSIMETVAKLNRELGITVLMVEHRLEMALKHASRMVVMEKGGILADGDPREILSGAAEKLRGIGIPKVAELHRLLAEKNLIPPPVSLSPEEFSAKLMEALNR